ncbi:MAG: hypothetical protein H7839_21255, partial [Magnetococcus sp. YQC-5]
SPTWLMILAGYKLPSQKSSINNCSARYFAIFCQALSTMETNMTSITDSPHITTRPNQLPEDLQAQLDDVTKKLNRGDYDFLFKKRENFGPSCADAVFNPYDKFNEWVQTFTNTLQ